MRGHHLAERRLQHPLERLIDVLDDVVDDVVGADVHLLRRRHALRPVFSSDTTCSSSPAFGTDCSPRISAGAEGPADLMRLPCSLSIAFTRPIVSPTTT